MDIKKTGPFELSFWGGTTIQYRRMHLSLKSATTEAERVLSEMHSRAAHPAIIYEHGKPQPVMTVR